MKKLSALLLVLAMVLSLAACASGQPEGTQTTKSTDPAQATSATEPNEEADPLSHSFTQFGDAKITIVGAEFVKNDYEEDILRIYYEYTNASTGDKARGHYPNTCLNFLSVTQDGNECLGYSFTPWDETYIPEDGNSDLYVQPGRTMRNTVCFRCDPNGGPVKLSCYVMVGSWMYNPDDIQPFEFEIDPADLMGVPAPFVLPPITNPTYTAGMSASGVYGFSENEISINGLELTKDSEGVDVVRVKLTVTNNGEESMTPVLICDLELYQDGIGLPYPTTWDLEDPTAEDEAYEEELEPGETVECNALFYLRNQNPVEAVTETHNDFTQLGARFDVKALLEAAAAAEQAANDAASAAEAAARKALVGTWLQRDSDWEDTYIFKEDGTGMLISGPEYPFTYSINGDILTLIYDVDDEEEFTFSVDGDLLTLIDMWDEELLLDKTADIDTEPTVEATTEPTTEPEETTEPENQIVLADALIGTWINESYGETYVFNADGTGYQIYEDVTYEYTYTIDDDYVEIAYADYDSDAFYIEIDDDTLIIAGYYVYTRQ